MNFRIKKGKELISDEELFIYKNELIINFWERYSYIDFKQYKNHLIINTSEGELDVAFTGEIVKLEFSSYCKDQLVLKVV